MPHLLKFVNFMVINLYLASMLKTAIELLGPTKPSMSALYDVLDFNQLKYVRRVFKCNAVTKIFSTFPLLNGIFFVFIFKISVFDDYQSKNIQFC